VSTSVLADTPVPILQHAFEFSKLLELYRERTPQRVLEIGTYHGGTLWHWLQNATATTRVVTVDSYMTGIDNRGLFVKWSQETGVDLEIVEGDSNADTTAARVRPFAPFDWIFIDAGHYLAEVTRDWELYSPMVADGGVIALHDILPPSEHHPEIQVAGLWNALVQTERTAEIVEDQDADWGGIGVVYR